MNIRVLGTEHESQLTITTTVRDQTLLDPMGTYTYIVSIHIHIK